LKIKAMPTIKSSDSKQPIDGEGKFVRSESFIIKLDRIVLF